MARSGRAKQATRRKSGGSFLLGVFVGLILGLGVALAVAFYLNNTPVPFASKKKPAGAEAAAEPEKLPPIAGMPQGGGAPAKPTEKPKFDFYRILPGSEEPVTDKELKERMRASRAQPSGAQPPGAPPPGAPGAQPPVQTKDVYFVQAGSFPNPVDADNQKAKLAMLGLESSVEPATLPDKGTWYRVRIGPYTRLEDLTQVRQTLAQNGIEASLVKIKSATPAKAR